MSASTRIWKGIRGPATKCAEERRLLYRAVVRIEVTSTLTQEDENHLAPAVLKLLSGVLAMLPVAYLVRVETTDQHVFQEVSPQVIAWDAGMPAAEAPRPFIES